MTKAMPFLQKAILLSYDPRRFALGLFFLLLCDLCVVLSFLGLEVCRPLIWIFYIPALVLLTYADTSRSCIHDT